MNEVLFRFNGQNPDLVEWVESGELSTHHGKLQDLAILCGGRRCVLVGDGRQIVLATTNIPARQRHTLLRAIPYALEEQFAEDVESLHFAVGERTASGEVPVAAVRDSELRGWLERCWAVGLNVSAVVVEQLLLPWEEHAWVLLADGDRVIVRQQLWAGFVTTRPMLPLMLPGVADGVENEDDEEPSVAPRLLLVGDLDAEDLGGDSGREVEVRPSDVPTLVVLATGYDPRAGINLLQGSYSPKARVGRYLKPWRVAAALLLVLLVVQFTFNMTEQARLETRDQRLTASIEQIYRQTFPESRKVVNARAQMESRLKALRQAGGRSANPFLQILADSGPLLRNAAGVKVTSLNYRDGTLAVGVSASSLQTVDQLRAQLVADTGLQVEIQSASSRDGKVNSRLLIREGVS